ncbi:hypothetical protein [Bordetella avium]|uniref:hypothetical protein n=1 Tax=Bordetella avium TaxID=521 RepID=UPI0011C44231|nr:hypothetical protein [Bordetella avium]
MGKLAEMVGFSEFCLSEGSVGTAREAAKISCISGAYSRKRHTQWLPDHSSGNAFRAKRRKSVHPLCCLPERFLIETHARPGNSSINALV